MALVRWGREWDPWRDLNALAGRASGFGDPWREFRELRDRVNHVFQSAYGGGAGVERGTSTFPPLNIYADRESVYVEARLPGVELADLEIAITGDTLSLKGERKRPGEVPDERYHRRERAFGHFNRLVSLNEQVDAERIEATLKDGILRVVLPKKPEAKPRQIQVKGA